MTARDEQRPEVARAVPELVALVAKMRDGDPYWRAGVVQGVVVHAANTGLTWPQIVVGLVRLAVDPEARPGELIPDSRDPLRPRPATEPNAEFLEAKAKIAREQR